ncbi:LysR substrate-binding domain-containing protein [Martelella soudanensis]|uniref:LysR substrate-binding domain-containing protein n=1 Tax=unclassified Martelella TaxID=2629616 RepID=UPI0015DF3373|nr:MULTISPECIES: LysR substrate-binding domain-containing protein [unclassified Martelella]
MSTTNPASLQGIRLRHIRCFLEIASERNISRAAANLGTAQPALSRSLRELEDLLGSPLFDRSRDGLTLTDAGQTFHMHVLRGMHEIAEGVGRVRTKDRKPALVIGAMPSVVRTLLPGWIAEFKKRHGDTSVRIITGSNADIMDKLRANEIEMAIGVGVDSQSMKGIRFERLFNEELVFAVTQNHPLRQIKSPGFDDLDRYPVIIPLPRSTIREDIDNYLASIGAGAFSNTIETASVEFACEYARENNAIVVFPVSALKPELESGRFTALFFANIRLISPIGLAFPRERETGDMAIALAEIIRDQASRTQNDRVTISKKV